MIETTQLISAAGEAVGYKKLSHALGLSLAHTYKLAADPMSLDQPVRNDLDRIGSVIDLLAALPHARPALILWKEFFDEAFNRALNREHLSALTCEAVPAVAEKLCREFADVLRECRKDYVPDALAKQAAELMAELSLLIRCGELKDDQPNRKHPPLRAS